MKLLVLILTFVFTSIFAQAEDKDPRCDEYFIDSKVEKLLQSTDLEDDVRTTVRTNSRGDWLVANENGVWLNGEMVIEPESTHRGFGASFAELNEKGDWIVLNLRGTWVNGVKVMGERVGSTWGQQHALHMSESGHWIIYSGTGVYRGKAGEYGDPAPEDN